MAFRDPSAPSPAPAAPTDGWAAQECATTAPGSGDREASTIELLEQLRQDRLWLLRQLDSGRWPQWRLDLAALERELGHLLDQATERLPRS